ncbi:MAG: hypothetical protein LBV04_06275 [Deferribacteraceae bacterium]|jgi:hypothetical protein|nr:hypothetical protein [Deferribacteraceae bacterium]
MSQFSDNFIAYGKEPSFEFTFDAVASQCFGTYWNDPEGHQIKKPSVEFLLEHLADFDPFKACVCAVIVGSCVENGFQSAKLDLILRFCKRISDLLLDLSDDEPSLESNPDGYRAYMGYYFMIQSTMAVATRDKTQRLTLADYREKFEQLSDHFDKYQYLTRVLDLCDEEKLVVIDVEHTRAWECTVQHVENNFSLLSLLQLAFHHAGILKEMHVDYKYCEDTDLYVHNRFDYGKKLSKDSDMAVFGFHTAHACVGGQFVNNPVTMVFGDMQVQSLPEIDDYKIILIHRENMLNRSWDVNFLAPVHPYPQPEFNIIKELTKGEATDWLQRICDKYK